MKKLVMIMALLMTATMANAQEEETEGTEEETESTEETSEPTDTTRFNIGDVEFLIIDHDTVPSGKNTYVDSVGKYHHKPSRNSMTYWQGFDVGMNLLMNHKKEFNSFNSDFMEMDPARSFNFSFNILEQRIRIAKDYFGIVTGLGFTNSRFGFNDDHMTLSANPDSTFGTIDSSLVSGFSKNQLRVNYFNVPLLLQFSTAKRPKKNFHIAFGVIGSVRMNSNVKYKYEQVNNVQAKHKDKGRYNLNPFQLASTVRIGYRNFGVFANYHFIPMFGKGKAEVAYPLTFGMSFHIG